MDELKHKIQSNLLLIVGVCVALGGVLHFGYGLMRGLLSPAAIFVGQHVTNPYSQHLWLQTLLVNIFFSALCGFLVALLALVIMQLLIRPRTMLYPQLAAIP
ncbi:MAG: hypothetical protein GY805_25740, partial [Chloroflexi bacterium]|nr:hypothetical protein [Chloroflexota bacterium]